MAPNQSPREFIDRYGPDTPVVTGGDKAMTLGQALAFEDLLCKADANRRQDPARRLAYLAKIVDAAGSLRPEDRSLLENKE